MTENRKPYQSRKGRPGSGRTSSVVPVRLPAAAYLRLLHQAKRAGKGTSTYARELVEWGLNRGGA